MFLEFCRHDGNRAIVTADNSINPIEKEGSVNVQIDSSSDGKIVLKHVYHVLGLKKNLVSVSQITDSGKYVLFGPSDVKVLDNVKHVDTNVLLIGKNKSLFVMSASEAYVEKTSQDDSAVIWHARLGHVGYQMLKIISSGRLIDGIPLMKDIRQDAVCHGC